MFDKLIGLVIRPDTQRIHRVIGHVESMSVAQTHNKTEQPINYIVDKYTCHFEWYTNIISAIFDCAQCRWRCWWWSWPAGDRRHGLSDGSVGSLSLSLPTSPLTTDTGTPAHNSRWFNCILNMRPWTWYAPAPICDSIMHKYPPICWYSNGMFARWRKLWFGIWASITGQLYRRRRVFSDTCCTCGSGRMILDLACAYLCGRMTTATDQIVAVMRHKRRHAIGAYNYRVRKLSELGFSFYRYDFVAIVQMFTQQTNKDCRS